MSEHLEVFGKVTHFHSAQEVFAYCRKCKKENTKLRVQFHQSFGDSYIKVICSKCNKTIFVSELEHFKYITLDRKCYICKKPTSHYDCTACIYSCKSKKTIYVCSGKCYAEFDRQKDAKNPQQKLEAK